MSDKHRIVLAKEDFSPDECELIKQLAGFDENAPDPKAELDRCLSDYLVFQNNYIFGTKKLCTDLEILELDYRVNYDHRILKSIDSRIKSVKSICGKLQKKNIPLTLENAAFELADIGGIRVVCYYMRDIYEIKKRLIAQDNVSLLKTADYIAEPKPSGYRSLHLILSTSVHLAYKNVEVPVEIQLRTVAMDSWAGLEHVLKYKNPNGVSDEISEQLSECADVISDTDAKMQEIYKSLFGKKTE